MKNLFGKKNAENKKEPDIKEQQMKALSQLNTQIKTLEEKISFLETKKNVETENAKRFLKEGNKDKAKKCLAKKKQYDEQIKQNDGALMMMEEQSMMLQNMESLKNVFETVKNANEALKLAQKGLTIDDINDIKDDLEVKFNVNVGYQSKCR